MDFFLSAVRRPSGKICSVLGCLSVAACASLAWLRADTPAHCSFNCSSDNLVEISEGNANRLFAPVLPPEKTDPYVHRNATSVQLCQALSPAAPNPITGVDCIYGNCG